MSDGPLAGVRVLDFTRALAGPFCTLVLAQLGAEVIKVEDPKGGDVARGNAPFLGPSGLGLAATGPDDLALALLNRNRGKRSITLDLKHPRARAVVADLVRAVDVVVENFAAGTADRLGVGYADCAAANPAVVYCSISGFGQGGAPGARAMDAIVQAASGIMLASGGAGDPPVRVGVPVADAIAPLYGVIGILAALRRRELSGEGAHVDISMLGVLTSLVATEDWDALATLGQPLRTGPTLPRLAPFGLYRCRDGWFSLVAPQDRDAAAVLGAVGRHELAADPRFATRDQRMANEPALTAVIEDWAAERSAAEAVAVLSAAGVACAEVREPAEALRDPGVEARGETVPVLHPVLGEVDALRTAGLPITFAGEGRVRLEPAPRLGEDTDAVLDALAGYGKEVIAELRREGAL